MLKHRWWQCCCNVPKTPDCFIVGVVFGDFCKLGRFRHLRRIQCLSNSLCKAKHASLLLKLLNFKNGQIVNPLYQCIRKILSEILTFCSILKRLFFRWRVENHLSCKNINDFSFFFFFLSFHCFASDCFSSRLEDKQMIFKPKHFLLQHWSKEIFCSKLN